MKLIVGLGNPGKEYDSTRHNIGWLFLDYIASKYNVSISKCWIYNICNSLFGYYIGPTKKKRNERNAIC